MLPLSNVSNYDSCREGLGFIYLVSRKLWRWDEDLSIESQMTARELRCVVYDGLDLMIPIKT